MEAIAIMESVLKKRTPYEKTVYLLKSYRDLKTGIIEERNSDVAKMIDKVLDLLKDERYIDIVKLVYVEGYTNEQTARKLGIDKRTLYRQKRKIIKRISIIIYGDEALL